MFTAEHQMEVSKSNFLNNHVFASPEFEWPGVNELIALRSYVEICSSSNLPTIVYLALAMDEFERKPQNFVDPDRVKLDFMTFSESKTDSFNRFDFDTVLYATLLQAKHDVSMENATLVANTFVFEVAKPSILPFGNMFHVLSTNKKSSWWCAACKCINNIADENKTELSQLFHEIKTNTLFKVANLFIERAKISINPNHRELLNNRSESLLKYALVSMQLQAGNVDESIKDEVIEEAVTFLAPEYFNRGEFQECLEVLKGINLPFPAYFRSEAYRKLSEFDLPEDTKLFYVQQSNAHFKEMVEYLKNYPLNHPLKIIMATDSRSVITGLTKTPAVYVNESSKFICIPFNSHPVAFENLK